MFHTQFLMSGAKGRAKKAKGLCLAECESASPNSGAKEDRGAYIFWCGSKIDLTAVCLLSDFLFKRISSLWLEATATPE